MRYNTKKETKFGNKVLKDMFFLLFNDKFTQDELKMY